MEKRELVQKEAVECIQKNDYTGLYVIAPRVGKTKIVIDAIGNRFDTWNCYVASPRVDIQLTWLNELARWKMCAGSPSLICFPSLKKIPENLDLLILDECQALSVAQMNMIKRKNPKRLLMITGTANRYTRGKLQYYLGIKDSYFEYPIEQAIADGIISNFHVYIIRVPMNSVLKTVPVKVKGRDTFNVTEKQNYEFLSAMFDQLRIDEKIRPHLAKTKELYSRRRANAIYEGAYKQVIVRNIQEKLSLDNRVLVFTARTEVADWISPYSYHSKNKKENNLKRFIEGEINTLSVVNMSDMGITFPDLKLEIIHQLQSNSDTSLQKFLRTCNLEGDKEATVIVTVYKDTMDESWARQAIEGVPEDKVTWLELEELDDLIQKLR